MQPGESRPRVSSAPSANGLRMQVRARLILTGRRGAGGFNRAAEMRFGAGGGG
ncbi:MAG: hypothetical protein JWM36_2202 [Hyphomicrobiales bacterium]|nr:hypothetical protein [Hyphomicrobiales bacterium]